MDPAASVAHKVEQPATIRLSQHQRRPTDHRTALGRAQVTGDTDYDWRHDQDLYLVVGLVATIDGDNYGDERVDRAQCNRSIYSTLARWVMITLMHKGSRRLAMSLLPTRSGLDVASKQSRSKESERSKSVHHGSLTRDATGTYNIGRGLTFYLDVLGRTCLYACGRLGCMTTRHSTWKRQSVLEKTNRKFPETHKSSKAQDIRIPAWRAHFRLSVATHRPLHRQTHTP